MNIALFQILGLLFSCLILAKISSDDGQEKLRKVSASKCDVISAPWPLGPKIATGKQTKMINDDIMVTDDILGEARPFYVPTEAPIDVFTVTETVTTFSTVTTSRIVNFGTSTTLTRSLTLTSTKFLTSTELSVDVKTATTTVSLSQTVFGGTVTRTTVIDTTVVSTLFITPIAATSESVLTRITRITRTVSVTATSQTAIRSTETNFDLQTITFFSIVFAYTSTTFFTIPSVFVSFLPTTRTLLGYTFTDTPKPFEITTSTATSFISVATSNTFITLETFVSFNFVNTIFVPRLIFDTATITPSDGGTITNFIYSTSTIE